VLGNTRDLSPSIDSLRGSPPKGIILSPLKDIGNIHYFIYIGNSSPKKQLFNDTPSHSAPLGKTREKILTCNQVRFWE
jgi:hypothetical protein